MDHAMRQRILELGMTAPSVDNSQPFYFRWDGDRLAVHRDGARDRRRGNAGNYVSMVGLGCLAECLAIAASGEGLTADIRLTYEADGADAHWLLVSFQSGAGEPDELIRGLKLRCSDRRVYQGGEPSDPVFQQAQAEAERFERCSFYLRDPDHSALLDYLKRCEGFLWEDEQVLPEMLSWVRWSRSAVQRTRDGMPWQSLAVSFPVSRLMQLVGRSERFRSFARRVGAPLRAQQQTSEAQVLSSAALGCLAVQDSQPLSMFQLGRAFLRIWVRLNLSGYGVQVMANPAMHAFQHAVGVLPDDYPEASKRVFAEGNRILSAAFGCPKDQTPAWMFRTGISSPLPAEMRTLRQPVSAHAG